MAIITHGRPKEIVLALSEALSELEDELTGAQGLSDDEGEMGIEASGDDLLDRMMCILEGYIQSEQIYPMTGYPRPFTLHAPAYASHSPAGSATLNADVTLPR